MGNQRAAKAIRGSIRMRVKVYYSYLSTAPSVGYRDHSRQADREVATEDNRYSLATQYLGHFLIDDLVCLFN